MKQPAVKEMSLFSITWPLVITFTLNLMMPVADSFFLSRVSDLAAGSVGAVLPFLMTSVIALMLLTQGGVSAASQYLGVGDEERAQAANLVTLMLGVSLSAGISIVLFLTSHDVGLWMGLSAKGNVYASHYLVVYGPFFVLKAIQSNLIQIIASRGKTILNLVGVLGMNLLNIGLNYTFYDGLFGLPRLGVKGVALATVICLCANVAFSLFALRFHLRIPIVKGISLALLREVRRPVLRIGVPSMVEPTSYQLYQVVITALIVALGTFSITTRVYTHNLVLITVISSLAIGNGAQIIIAHLAGAGEYHRADQKLRQAVGAAVVLSMTLIALIWLLASPILGLFTDNRDIVAFGKHLLLLEFVAGPSRAFNIIVNNALRCTGDAKVPALVGASMMWTIGLGTAYLFGFVWELGLWGIWVALAADETTRAVYCYSRWRKGVWQTTGVNRQPATR